MYQTKLLFKTSFSSYFSKSNLSESGDSANFSSFTTSLQEQYTFHILITKYSRSCEATLLTYERHFQKHESTKFLQMKRRRRIATPRSGMTLRKTDYIYQAVTSTWNFLRSSEMPLDGIWSQDAQTSPDRRFSPRLRKASAGPRPSPPRTHALMVSASLLPSSREQGPNWRRITWFISPIFFSGKPE